MSHDIQFNCQDSARNLPIQDTESLKRALAAGDPATLLMVLMHFESDEELLEKFSPYIGNIFEPPKEIPPALAEVLRNKLFAILTTSSIESACSLDAQLFRKMLNTDVGEPVEDKFIPMLLEQMGFQKSQKKPSADTQCSKKRDFNVLVVGAGFTGMLAAIKLREAGFDFTVIEKNPEVGGTWYENTYPGCAVDTPSHFYSYSFELNPNWSHYTPAGPEFQRYLLDVADRYDLRRHTRFNTRVLGFRWDEAAAHWEVTLEDASGRHTVTANAVINSHGPVNRWSIPKIPGIETFKGKVMHTAGWDSSYDLTGKKVAQIGTAASGVQVGPAIADKVDHLTIFQRSRHWVMPNHYVEVPEDIRWAQAHIPFYAEWFRFRAYWFAADGLYANIEIDPSWPHQDRSISEYNDLVRQYCLQNYQTKLADRPDLMEKLIPDYPVFGKRICMDINWLNTLCRDNVTLEDNNLDRISERGMVLKDGTEVEVDVIICATGFDVADMTGGLPIIGRDGVNLSEQWHKDDPRAYLGVMVPGFPNFFLSVGPNSAPNHAGGQNIISETQIHYTIECLEALQAQGARALEPTAAATDAFNEKIDHKLQSLIWSRPDCNSYYKNKSGRIIMSSPYRLVEYWLMTRSPSLEDFQLQRDSEVPKRANA